MLKRLSLALVAASWIFSLLVYRQLPERIATQWDMDGQVDRWDSRLVGAFIIPLLMAVIWAVARRSPRLSLQEEGKRFAETYELMITAMLAFLALVHLAMVGGALGWDVSVPRVLPLGIGTLLIIMGRIMPRIRRNWIVGIRTPWTLSSDRVWERTHRVGGAVLTISGAAIALAFFLDGIRAFGFILGVLLAAGIGTVGYSYLIWREERSG